MTGRKRHLLVDTGGLPVGLAVTAASVGDRAGAKEILAEAGPDLPRLEHLWADACYNGAPFAEWAEEKGGWTVEVVRKAEDGSFTGASAPVGRRVHVCVALQVSPLRSDFERLIESVVGFIHAAMLRLVVRRLALINEHS